MAAGFGIRSHDTKYGAQCAPYITAAGWKPVPPKPSFPPQGEMAGVRGEPSGAIFPLTLPLSPIGGEGKQ
jgi:hypothetical protein